MDNLLIWLVVFRHPSEKYELASWDDAIPGKNKACSKAPSRFEILYRNCILGDLKILKFQFQNDEKPFIS